MKPPTVLLISHPTLGLRHDALVLGQALRARHPDVRILSFEVPMRLARGATLKLPSELVPALPADAAVFLEHAFDAAPLMTDAVAKRRVYVPNVEWLQPGDRAALESGRIDALLYKNREAEQLLEALPVNGIGVRRIVGWTSADIGAVADPDQRFDRFLHVRGVSAQKQTDVVIETWIAHPHWPKLTVSLTERGGLEISRPLAIADNIEVVLRRLPTDELRSLQRAHGIHVAPSLAEGFGHSLNEARACGAVLITTDAPPMNDLVIAGETGELVAVDPADVGTFRWTPAYPVRQAALADAIERVLRRPIEARSTMGAAGRSAFLADRASFTKAIGDVFEEIGVL